jgi:hypothetical protein
MRKTSIVMLAVATACGGVSSAVAQSRVVPLTAGDHGNGYTVAYTLSDLSGFSLYQVSLCGPRSTLGGVLADFWISLAGDNGEPRFDMVTNAKYDGDFAVLEFSIAPELLDRTRISARFSRSAPNQRIEGYIDSIDLSLVRTSPGVQLNDAHAKVSCEELTDAARTVSQR